MGRRRRFLVAMVVMGMVVAACPGNTSVTEDDARPSQQPDDDGREPTELLQPDAVFNSLQSALGSSFESGAGVSWTVLPKLTARAVGTSAHFSLQVSGEVDGVTAELEELPWRLDETGQPQLLGPGDPPEIAPGEATPSNARSDAVDAGFLAGLEVRCDAPGLVAIRFDIDIAGTDGVSPHAFLVCLEDGGTAQGMASADGTFAFAAGDCRGFTGSFEFEWTIVGGALVLTIRQPATGQAVDGPMSLLPETPIALDIGSNLERYPELLFLSPTNGVASYEHFAEGGCTGQGLVTFAFQKSLCEQLTFDGGPCPFAEPSTTGLGCPFDDASTCEEFATLACEAAGTCPE